MKPEDIAYLSALFAANKKKLNSNPIEAKVEAEVEVEPIPEKKNRRPTKKIV